MRLCIPFQYTANYVERGRRNHSQATFAAEAHVSVREVATSEAKVAFVVADASGGEPRLGPVAGRGRRIVSLGGELWRELMTEGEFKALVEARPERDEEFDRRVHDNPFIQPGKEVLCWVPQSAATTRAEVEARVGVRQWFDDLGRAKAERAQLVANTLVVIGGSVYERCEEPCWEVTLRGCGGDAAAADVADADGEGGPRLEVVVGIGFSGPQASEARLKIYGHRMRGAGGDKVWPPAPQLFNLARGGEALAFAREFGALLKPQAARVRLAAKAKLNLPAAAAYADDCHAVEAAAKEALHAFKKYLTSVSREASLAWFALRDLSEASRGRITPALAEAVARVAETWSADTDRNSYERRHGYREEYGEAGYAFSVGNVGNAGSEGIDAECALASCESAARRWARRPADGREWVNFLSARREVAVNDIVAEQVLTLEEAREAARAVGADLDADAAAAADGRSHLVVAKERGRVVGVAVLDEAGIVERALGSWGRGAPRDAIEAFARFGQHLRDAAPDDAGVPTPR